MARKRAHHIPCGRNHPPHEEQLASQAKEIFDVSRALRAEARSRKDALFDLLYRILKAIEHGEVRINDAVQHGIEERAGSRTEDFRVALPARNRICKHRDGFVADGNEIMITEIQVDFL